MLPLSPLLLLLCPAVICVAAHGAGDLHGFTLPAGSTVFHPTDPCMVVAPPCVNEADRYSLEALQSIHHMMDDDQDGGIEVEESMEFIIEDLKLQQTNKHSNLHREDQHITIEELWRGWKSSEVHNWTQDDVLRWLRDFVELPQYEKNFKEFKVNGNTLPRIAANEPSFLSTQLRVQDQRDKHKLNIKALDVVLFGAPTRPHNYMKDLLLIVSVVMGVGGCWFAQAQNKASKVHISKMMKDLESLQSAEQSLMELQTQLERAQEEKRNVAEEKENLEVKMRDEIMGAQEEAYRLHELRQGAVTELSRLRYAEEELEQVLGALKQAEKDMQASWTVSEALQQWLQLTYEVEVQYYNVKKQGAELQLAAAKEEAEKIKKKRSSVLGTLHVAHSSSLDQVDQKILEAKNALSEVTACLRERLHRWQQIERLCGFPIMRNSGLATLTAQLYSDSFALGLPRVFQTPCSCHSSLHGSIEDLLEESPILPQMTVSPLKRSPRTHCSTICRPRRSGAITQPPTTMISQDPDLLIPIRAPYPCFDEEESFLLKTLKKQDSLETHSDTEHTHSPSLGKLYRSPTVDATPQKLHHDDTGLLADSSVTKSSIREAEVAPVRKYSTGDIEADVASRKTAKDKFLHDSSESLRMPKEESLMEPAARKISREIIGTAFDSRKISRDDTEHLFDSVPRRITRESMGMSFDAGSRKLARIKGDCLLDSSVLSLAKDKIVETAKTQQRISRDESEYSADSASLKMLPREKFDALMDTLPYAEKQEFGLEAANRRILRDEHEMSAGSVRRRIPRLTRDDSNVSIDSLTGRLWVDVGSSESTSPSNRFEQPDLMVTSQGPIISSDLFNVGLVYDGILEKSCSSSAPPQSRQITDVEPPVPPPRAATQSHTSPPETGGEKSRDKEKSKKSLKLKSLFKKKNESAAEKPQSGLHKL